MNVMNSSSVYACGPCECDAHRPELSASRSLVLDHVSAMLFLSVCACVKSYSASFPVRLCAHCLIQSFFLC